MATVDDPETNVETEKEVETDPTPMLRWDESVGPVPIGLGWEAEPVVLDWFGRGEPDLLVVGGGGPAGRVARIYRSLGRAEDAQARYDAGADVEGLDGLRLPCPIPNGAPSRFDLVAMAPEGLVLLRNRGAAGRPEFGPRQPLGLPADLGIGHARVVQMVAVDWDGDGLVDLLVGLDDLEGYWPEDDRVPRDQQIGFNRRGGHPGYDASGRWRGRLPEGRIAWLRNEGSASEPRFVLRTDIDSDVGPLEVAPHPAPLTICWGGRGAWELLLTDARGEVRLFRNFGGQRPPVLMEARTLVAGGRPLALPDDRTTLAAADLDGDGKPELVFGTSDGRVFAVHAGVGRDQAMPPEPILHEGRSLWLGGRAVLAAGDLDADGDLDLVVGDAPGRLHWVRDLGGPGDHRYAAPVALEAGGEPFRLDPGPDGLLDGPVSPRLGHACPTLVDWTGHGRIDLIVGGAGGEVLYLRNNGIATDPRFDIPKPLRCDGGPLIVPSRVRPAVADWEGAGQPDLIALDLQGFLCVYPRTGPLELGRPVPLVDRLGRLIRLDGSFGLGGRCALWAGPWTGSGRIDLLVGLPRGSRFVIPALTGRPLGRLEALPTVVLLENAGRDGLVPRPLYHADGSPVVVGSDGCSPCGVDGSGRGTLDLLVGSDDGRVEYFRREDLRW